MYIYIEGWIAHVDYENSSNPNGALVKTKELGLILKNCEPKRDKE